MSLRMRGGRKPNQVLQGQVPLIHRSMSITVARSIVWEVGLIDPVLVGPELTALAKDLQDILRQLESGHVQRPC